MSWTRSKIAVLDFEGEIRTGVVEFGIVIIKGSQIISTETKQCRPRGKLQQKSIEIHGLRERELAGLETFQKKQSYFAELRCSVDVFCAHHASVEENLLKNAWPYRPIRNEQQDLHWGPWVDTHRLYKKLYPDIGNYSLAHLVSTFELRNDLEKNALIYCPQGRQKYHCALYDTLASALLLTRLSELPKISEASLEWMIEASASGQKKSDHLTQASLFDR
ncbi:3'-5' exonuclease [Opitutales bacterium]|jgi:DNA polymerase III alpha subunit (gram-positive type)|nr:3'-5' exonuclease [Opitutales bacterium]